MSTQTKKSGPRLVRAPRGSRLSCHGWRQEAALRLLMNNLDPEVAEKPDELVVYGKVFRTTRPCSFNPENRWGCFEPMPRLRAC
jgi:urocanate hydratase